MNKRNKQKLLITIFSSLLTLVLICSLTICAVTFAATVRGNVKVGGSISFKATGINATISKGVVSGGSLTNADSKLKAITFDADNDGSATISSWDGLDLKFNDNGDNVTLSFSITNNDVGKYLKVDILTTNGDADNATMTLSATSTDSTIPTTNAEEIEIPAKAETASVVNYTITFKVTDKNQDASIDGFAFNFELTPLLIYDVTLINSIGENTPNWDSQYYTETVYYAVDGETSWHALSKGSTKVIQVREKILITASNSNAVDWNSTMPTLPTTVDSGIHASLSVDSHHVDSAQLLGFNSVSVKGFMITANSTITFSFSIA